MSKLSWLLGGVALFALAPSIQADPVKLNLCTGSKEGVYIQIGDIIKSHIDPTVVDLNVISTNGTVDNINRTVTRQKTEQTHVSGETCDAMIGQPDGWTALKRDDPKNADKLRSIMDLHREYAQLLCSKESGIESINDYEDSPTLKITKHNIAVGPQGSGTWLLWNNWGYEDSSYSSEYIEPRPETGDDAIVELQQGRIECMLVSGAVPTGVVTAASQTGDIVLAKIGDWDLNDSVDDAGNKLYEFTDIPNKEFYPDFGYWSNVESISWRAKLYINADRITGDQRKALIRATRDSLAQITGKWGK